MENNIITYLEILNNLYEGVYIVDEDGNSLCFGGCPLHKVIIDGKERMKECI